MSGQGGAKAAGGKVVPLRASRPCPICGKKSVPDFHPFCSKHCADVDLNRWLKGAYAIPAVEPPDEWDEGAGRGDGEEE
ncbi:MAG: DNA gyrase inhibitor YacG [Parvibaculum sp.]|uniref:DNA gyrase inhibitor YacG n=1 Tax=Parvibaculum sp. TaxID=2024848 RepID=UPI003C792DFE